MRNQRKVFVEEYLKSWNATEAAKQAGYSEKTARAQGSRLLTKVDIQAEIKRRIDERAMKADEVLDRLADQARGDIGDFLDIGTMGSTVDLYHAREQGLTHLVKKVKTRTTTTISKDGTESETHDTEIELYDAQAALKILGQHHKLFVERVELDHTVHVDGFEDLLNKVYGTGS